MTGARGRERGRLKESKHRTSTPDIEFGFPFGARRKDIEEKI